MLGIFWSGELQLLLLHKVVAAAEDHKILLQNKRNLRKIEKRIKRKRRRKRKTKNLNGI
jgi:hypothetical protein